MEPSGRVFQVGALLTALGGVACEEEVGLGQVEGNLRAPALFDYGDLPLGLEIRRTVEVENSGSGSLDLGELRVVDAGPGRSVRFAAGQPTSIGPGQSVSLALRIQILETSDEPVDSTLSITADLGNETQTVQTAIRTRGVDLSLFIEPNPVDFGVVRLGTTARRTVRLVNLLSEPADLLVPHEGTSALLDEGNAFFEVLNPVDPRREGSLLPDGTSLPPAGTFELEVEFRPSPLSVEAPNEGELSIRSCPEDFCISTLRMRGRAVRAGLECTPENVLFGTLRPGTVESTFVRCTNVANVPIQVLDWSLAETSDDAFILEPFPGEETVYQPGDTFEFEVRFEPDTSRLGQALFGRVDISAKTEEDRRPTIELEIRLEGAPGGPVILVEPDPLAAGDVAIGTTGSIVGAVANAGFDILDLREVAIAGPDAPRFSIVEPEGSIAPGSDSDFTVTFTPDPGCADLCPAEARLVLVSNDALSPRVEVPITARSVALDLSRCAVSAQPERVRFGTVQIGGTVQRPVVLSNVGTGRCVVREFVIEGSDLFRLAVAPGPSVLLEAGQRSVLEVEFIPSAAREFNASLDYAVSASPAAGRVSLEGVGGTGTIQVAPAELDFGPIELGCRAPEETVLISNQSSTELGIAALELVSLTGDDVFGFGRLPPGLPPQPGDVRPIAPGQQLSIPITYDPPVEGSSIAELRVSINGQPTPSIVPIRGAAEANAEVIDRFRQADNKKVDLLWVLDNSFSMQQEIAFLREAADDVFQALIDAGIDYQTAVISTDMNGSTTSPCGFPRPSPQGDWIRGSCGYFSDGDARQQRPEWRIVTPASVPTPQDVFRRVTDLPFPGSPDERGLLAMTSALTPPHTLGWNRDFIRPDADLAIIILSDESDESPAPVDDYVRVLQALKSSSRTRLTISAVIPPDVAFCTGGAPLEGCPEEQLLELVNDYRRAVRLTNGIALDSTWDQDAPLQEQQDTYAARLFEATFASISLRGVFPLSRQPAPGTVSVRINRVPLPENSAAGGVNWEYDDSANRVLFTDRGRPPPGSDIEVRYQTLCLP